MTAANALLSYENPGISIGGFKIYAYAIIIVCGMVAAFFVISLLFRRRNMSADLFLTYFVITLPVAIVTTRLFYCITDGLPLKEWFSFESIREGGLSIIGGILGGSVSVILISIFKKTNIFRALDCIVIGVLLAQAIGRWGNFANQEVYGAEVKNSALQFFPFAVYINKTSGGNCLQSIVLTFQKMFGIESQISGGTWHYAFFFYESILNLAAAIAMFFFAWKNPKKPNGVLVSWYFIHYGFVRSIMEPLRDPSYILNGGGVRWSLVMSVLMCVSGVALLCILLWLNHKKEGRYFGSEKGDPYGIADYIKDNPKEVAYLDKINMMCAIYPEKYVKPAPENQRKSRLKPDDGKETERDADEVIDKQSDARTDSHIDAHSENNDEKKGDKE